MRWRTIIIGIIILPVLVFNNITQQSDFSKEIDKVIDYYAVNGMFNGCILVAENNNIIYENAFGYSDFEEKKYNSIESVFCIGSITKQFTALSIMILQERGKLSYDDKIVKFFPEFKDFADEVTIRHLLTHTSGLLDYLNDLSLHEKLPEVNDEIVFDSLVATKRLKFKQGEKYSYSNSGYFLLAIIIEKITGKSYREFISENIFEPLGMKNSYVLDKSFYDIPNKVKSYEFWQEIDTDLRVKVNGHGNIYSTVKDLLVWNNSLSTYKLVGKSTLDIAFSPPKLSNGEETDYGFGWHIEEDQNEKTIFHRGGIAGFRAYNSFRLNNKISLIIFANNKEMSEVNAIINNLENILNRKPYTLKKKSICDYFYELWYFRGLKAAQNKIQHVLKNERSKYDLSEFRLNELGYHFLLRGDIDAAIETFKINVELYPESSNAYDSLGEAYMKNGQIDLAITNYKKSLELNPENNSAIEMLKKLQKK